MQINNESNFDEEFYIDQKSEYTSFYKVQWQNHYLHLRLKITSFAQLLLLIHSILCT